MIAWVVLVAVVVAASLAYARHVAKCEERDIERAIELRQAARKHAAHEHADV